jgi:hypothetical protein
MDEERRPASSRSTSESRLSVYGQEEMFGPQLVPLLLVVTAATVLSKVYEVLPGLRLRARQASVAAA